MAFDNTISGSNHDVMSAYHGISPTEQEIDDYGYDYDYPASTQADSVSLPTTVHDERWQSGLNVEPSPGHPNTETIKGSRRSTVYFSAILLTSVIPLCGMIAWIITVVLQQGGSVFTGFGSAKIGGHLTQTQAKAIDFSCSALLAPLLMAGLNFIWFACARVCVVNERSATHLSGHGVPLQSLARASRTSVGTYDIIGLWELFNAKRWRLSVLGAVALLSAISSSALSNIIAYESFEEDGPSSVGYALRTLSDDFILRDEVSAIMAEGAEIYYHDPDQIKLAAHNMSMMLDGLFLESAALDSEGGYIGPNATDPSLDSIAGEVMSLHNVPGYRLAADCTPTTLEKDSLSLLYAEVGNVRFDMSAELPSALATKFNITYNTNWLEYQWTGNPQDYHFDQNPPFDFAAFHVLQPEFVYLVHLEGGAGLPSRSNESVSERTIPTAWGGLSPIYQNITVPDPILSYVTIPESTDSRSGTYSYVTNSYALECVLLRQEGFLEYGRRDDQTWFIASASFQEDRKPFPSLFQDFQIKLSLERPAPPLGDVLWGGATSMEVCNQQLNLDQDCTGYKNFSTAVNNFVYASGEAFRIIYNVGALNTSGDPQNYFYNVTGEVERQFYRITYVPALLLVALLGITICSLLVTVLVMATMKTWSWKIFRQVDITRLVVDCVGADLAKNGPDFTRLGRASDDELEKWARKYRVAYEKVVDVQNDDGGEPWVRLRHTAGSDVQKPGSNESVHRVEQ